MENKAETCPRCGHKAEPRVEVRPRRDGGSHAEGARRGDAAWLRGELKLALRFILVNALSGLLLMAAGGLIGLLVHGTDGLIVGAAVGLVIKLLL